MFLASENMIDGVDGSMVGTCGNKKGRPCEFSKRLMLEAVLLIS